MLQNTTMLYYMTAFSIEIVFFLLANHLLHVLWLISCYTFLGYGGRVGSNKRVLIETVSSACEQITGEGKGW